MSETAYDNRLGASRSDDIEAFVPDDADPINGDGDPAGPHVSPLFATDDQLYSTGVHCKRCYCGVAVVERGTGTTRCPNCGWSSDDDGERVAE